MFLALINQTTFFSLLKSPSLLFSSFGLIFFRRAEKAKEIFLSVAKTNQEILKSKKLQQSDKLANFLCDLHLQNEVNLNSGIYDEYSWMFKRVKGKIWISLAWMWAIQAELGLDLLPKELFIISQTNNKHLRLADHIHYIHRATYNI